MSGEGARAGGVAGRGQNSGLPAAPMTDATTPPGTNTGAGRLVSNSNKGGSFGLP
jgi:hypothetical protein